MGCPFEFRSKRSTPSARTSQTRKIAFQFEVVSRRTSGLEPLWRFRLLESIWPWVKTPNFPIPTKIPTTIWVASSPIPKRDLRFGPWASESHPHRIPSDQAALGAVQAGQIYLDGVKAPLGMRTPFLSFAGQWGTIQE